MANGMASLFVGASGLKSAQTALNTTAHNLSNINTEGYTRQHTLSLHDALPISWCWDKRNQKNKRRIYR